MCSVQFSSNWSWKGLCSCLKLNKITLRNFCRIDQFCSIQFKMVCQCLEKPIHAHTHLSQVSRTLPFFWPLALQASLSSRSLLSPPSSSTTAVKHGPRLRTLTKKDPGFRNQVPEETSPHLQSAAQDHWPGAGHDQLPCGSTWTSSGNCQATEACMVSACHMPW